MRIYHFLTVFVLIIFALSLALYTYQRTVYRVKLELQLVTVVFRHGDRMPYTDDGEGYANNPNAENNYFPMGQGGLTNEAKNRDYEFGQFLRERYKNFLDSTYLPEVLEGRSTNYDSTKTSLQLVLAGLYPPNNYQMWDSSIKWQPIPTSYEPQTEDILLTSMNCPRYLQEHEKVMEMAEVKEKLKNFEDLMKNLSVLVGKPINTTSDVNKIHYTLEMEHKMNLTIPNWGYDYLYNQDVMSAIMFDYEIMIYNDLLKKLSGGPLIRKMLQDMMRMKNGPVMKGRKIFLYSGHKKNLVVLLSALGVDAFYTENIPKAIIVEFFRFDEKFYVKILYYQGIPNEIRILKIPGCSKFCPLEKFIKLTKSTTPSEDESICD